MDIDAAGYEARVCDFATVVATINTATGMVFKPMSTSNRHNDIHRTKPDSNNTHSHQYYSACQSRGSQ